MVVVVAVAAVPIPVGAGGRSLADGPGSLRTTATVMRSCYRWFFLNARNSCDGAGRMWMLWHEEENCAFLKELLEWRQREKGILLECAGGLTWDCYNTRPSSRLEIKNVVAWPPLRFSKLFGSHFSRGE